jgi:hypothetical protein
LAVPRISKKTGQLAPSGCHWMKRSPVGSVSSCARNVFRLARQLSPVLPVISHVADSDQLS